MRSKEFISEKWTKKYKNSINCNNPKGFSQKAHCAGLKKVNEGEVVSLHEGYSTGASGGVGLGEEALQEYGEYDTKRIIQFSKENQPDLSYLYQQFVQRMLNPENTVDPNEWISKVNEYYGLNYSWKDYQKLGHNDHTNNWQKIINKYIVNRK